MLNILDTVKNLCKQDNASRSEIAYFPALGLTLDNEILEESPMMEDSLFDGEDIRFGACVSTQKRLTVIDVEQDVTGLEFTNTHIVEGNQIPLGIFKVETATKQEDLIFKDIVAYDRMKKIDVDVAAWYNSLTFPTTLAALRSSFLTYVGLTQDTTNLPLPNDSMTVMKTIEPASLPGRTVIEAIEEINGVFGQMSRTGEFSHVILKPVYGLYPGTFYPGQEYPRSETDTSYVRADLIDETITEQMRKSIKFEEYTVKEIDKLIVRTDADDIGAIVGTGTNAYVIEGNFLLYGKSATELQTIATNAFGHMAKRPYRPYESDNIGLPYLEPGDMLKFNQADPVIGYMLKRTLRGIQSLRDEISASGSKERTQRTDTNKEILILKGKTTKIQKDVDGVRVEVTDLAENTDVQFVITANSIEQKVSKDGVIAAINITPETVKIAAGKIVFEGLVTANNNFKILLDGSIEALNGKFSGVINGGSININDKFLVDSGGNMSATGASLSGTFSTSGSNGTTTISNGGIDSDFASIDTAVVNTQLDVGSGIHMVAYTGSIAATSMSTNSLNGGTPVTSANISGQSVNYANTAGSASSSSVASSATVATNALGLAYAGYPNWTGVYFSAADNFRPSVDDLSSCGSSESKWSDVYSYNGTIITSDARKKYDIELLDNKYIELAKAIVPKSFKRLNGKSGRTHLGFIAQEIEEAMQTRGITDMDFAGLIKSPVYADRLIDSDGNKTNEYDTSSEVIDHDYGLRDNEFIPLLFGWIGDINKRLELLEIG